MNSIETDKCTIGLGFGQVYGGLGGNFLFYPQRNLGIFGGFGYAFAGAGYNVGTKFRFIKENSGSKIIPSIDIMYGYNASIVVANATQYNKLFYGPTIGFGLDIKSTSNRGYLSVDLLIPIRSSEVQSYIDELKNNHGVEFKNSLLPISISVGYRFVLN
jgi:hypothetical protein